MGGHQLLLEWHGSAMISRIVWEFVEGFLERISRLKTFTLFIRGLLSIATNNNNITHYT